MYKTNMMLKSSLKSILLKNNNNLFLDNFLNISESILVQCKENNIVNPQMHIVSIC